MAEDDSPGRSALGQRIGTTQASSLRNRSNVRHVPERHRGCGGRVLHHHRNRPHQRRTSLAPDPQRLSSADGAEDGDRCLAAGEATLMPDRVKLANPGDELVMVVKAVKAETVERNDYYL